MPSSGCYYSLWEYLREKFADSREREIERCRLLGMKSPLSFAERKARRILKAREG